MDPNVIDSLLQPGHLVLAGGLVGLGFFGVTWFLPYQIKKAMLNGSGQIIRMIMAEENAKQSEHNEEKFKTMLKDAITAHEEVEQLKLKQAFLEHQQGEEGRQKLWEDS